MASAGQGKTTICHAAGRAEPNGPTQYVKITISNSALYGQNGNAGHFEENGTPAAGHEEDFILYGSSCDSGGGEG